MSHKPVTTEELAAAEHAAQQIRDHGRDRGVSAVVLSELAARIARDLATEHATFMGPKTCAKLSADFVNNQKRADAADEYFRAKYADWRKAFAIASDGGAVDFH